MGIERAIILASRIQVEVDMMAYAVGMIPFRTDEYYEVLIV